MPRFENSRYCDIDHVANRPPGTNLWRFRKICEKGHALAYNVLVGGSRLPCPWERVAHGGSVVRSSGCGQAVVSALEEAGHTVRAMTRRR